MRDHDKYRDAALQGTARAKGTALNILMLNHNVVRSGGTYYRAYDLARYLVRRGHVVTLLSISAHRRWSFAQERMEGVQIVHTPDLLWSVGRTGWDPWDTLRRIGYLRGRSWDIIHAFDSRPAVVLPALFARRQSRQVGGRLIMDWCDWWGHGGIIQERSGWAMRTFFGPVETCFEEGFRARADGTTVISRALYERACSLGVPAETIHLLAQGCDVDNIRPGDRLQARQRLGLSPSVRLIGSVGTLNRSDARLFFDTVALLLHSRADCRVALIGRHRAHVPDALRQDGRLIETGFVPEAALHDYLAACDVLIAPLGNTLTSRARWPSKVNLFLSAGRAVVMPRVGDLAQVLEHEGAGWVAPCTANDMANQIIWLLDHNEVRERCEMRARQVAESLLCWTGIVGKLEDFYRQVLRGSGAEDGA